MWSLKNMINVASTSLHAATIGLCVVQVGCWWLHASKTSLCMRTGYVKWNKPHSVSWHWHVMFRGQFCAQILCKICLICDRQLHAITMQFIHRTISNMMTEFGIVGCGFKQWRHAKNQKICWAIWNRLTEIWASNGKKHVSEHNMV